MASNPLPQKYTVAEYLELEKQTGIRFEYINGEVFAMAGGTENHSYITTNCIGELYAKLKGSSCRAHGSDMKIHITDMKYVYPDSSVICGDPIYADDNRTMLTNPTLVCEILSPSSEAYDLGKKAEMYRSLPSLQVYLILAQDEPYAQLYTRHEAGWLLRDYRGLDIEITLNALNITLAMRDIYANIQFPD